MTRFTDSPYEYLLTQKPYVGKKAEPGPICYPPESMCAGCPYGKGQPCIGVCMKKLLSQAKGDRNHKENMARLHKELESAKEEAERPFAQEAELLEKSARLAELNTVLDNEEKGGSGETPGEPARETEEDAGRGSEKTSILQTLKEYKCPARVPHGTGRGQEREAI